jgi:hypothetical protein
MNNDKDKIRALLQERFDELKKTKLPRGSIRILEDTILKTYTYEAYIAGLATACLTSNKEIDADTINLNPHILENINDCQERLNALKAYFQLLHDVGQLVHDYYSI